MLGGFTSMVDDRFNHFRIINRVLEKGMPVLTPVSVAIGVWMAERFSNFASAVPWLFAVISFVGALGLTLVDIRERLRRPQAMIVTLFILQILMPLIALLVGMWLFDPMTRSGLVLAFSIPTGVMSLMWVTIYHGNKSFALAVVFIHTLLSPFFIPWTLRWFIGTDIPFDVGGMVWGLLWMIVIPSLLAISATRYTPKVVPMMKDVLSPIAKLHLFLIIMINSSVAAPFIRSWDLSLLYIILTVLAIALSGYGLGYVGARLLKLDESMRISMVYTCGMRNIGAGAALAVAYFPPPVMVPIVAAILFQQVLAAALGKWMRTGRTDQSLIERGTT